MVMQCMQTLEERHGKRKIHKVKRINLVTMQLLLKVSISSLQKVGVGYSILKLQLISLKLLQDITVA